MPRKIEQTTIDKILELSDQRYSLKEIAEKLNVHLNTVKKYTNVYNKPCHSIKFASEYKDLILQRLDEGKNSEEIGQEIGLSGATVRRFCTENNIPLSRKRIRLQRCKEVKKLHDAGKLPIEIEAELGIATPTLKLCYKELGIQPNTNRLCTISQLDPSENIEYVDLDGRSGSATKQEKLDYIQKVFNKIAYEKQRYVCGEDLKAYGISIYHLSTLKFSIVKANEKLGLYKTQSVFEDMVIHILRDHNIVFETQKTYDTCKSNKGHLLRFDLYIPCINTLVELDGNQHVDNKSPWANPGQWERDSVKTNWCRTNNIPLIRIPYNRHPTWESIQHFLQIPRELLETREDDNATA